MPGRYGQPGVQNRREVPDRALEKYPVNIVGDGQILCLGSLCHLLHDDLPCIEDLEMALGVTCHHYRSSPVLAVAIADLIQNAEPSCIQEQKTGNGYLLVRPFRLEGNAVMPEELPAYYLVPA